MFGAIRASGAMRKALESSRCYLVGHCCYYRGIQQGTMVMTSNARTMSQSSSVSSRLESYQLAISYHSGRVGLIERQSCSLQPQRYYTYGTKCNAIHKSGLNMPNCGANNRIGICCYSTTTKRPLKSSFHKRTFPYGAGAIAGMIAGTLGVIALTNSTVISKPAIVIEAEAAETILDAEATTTATTTEAVTSVENNEKAQSIDELVALVLAAQKHNKVVNSEEEKGQGAIATTVVEQSQSSITTTVPQIVLYQYTACPFCTKTRTFFDYHGLKYTLVEVDPLRKKRLKFSEYRKVPVCTVNGVQINDSVRIIEVVSRALNLPSVPGVSTAVAGGSSATRRSDAEWAAWAEDFVRLLTSNIYRTPGEALESFDYLLEPQFGFSSTQQAAARYVGAGIMWAVSEYKLNRKYGITDPRAQMYAACEELVSELDGRTFLSGGEAPSAADLTIYAYIRAIEGTRAHVDLMATCKGIHKWYFATKSAVGESGGSHATAEELQRLGQ